MKQLSNYPLFHRFPGYVWWTGLGLQAALLAPYLAGLFLTPPNFHFGGLVYNPDDPYVYLSWMRQAAEGHVLFRNLFTLEPQRAASFHLLFLTLGALAGVIHAPLVLVYHFARGVLDLILVLVLWAVVALTTTDHHQRRRGLALILLGSGLGWSFFLAGSPLVNGADLMHVPTDAWMTETTPFLSMLLNPLFVCALILLVGSFVCLFLGERLQHLRWSVSGGILALLLGNIHSYDILVLHPVWWVFLAVLYWRRSKLPPGWDGWTIQGACLRYGIAGAISAPSVFEQAWVFHSDPAFHARALVATTSPAFPYLILGIGLLLPLSVFGFWRRSCDPVVWWLASWAVVGLILPYVPVAFQRKLAIGIDIPYLALAAVGLNDLLSRLSKQPALTRGLFSISLAILGATNVAFLASDLLLLIRNQSNVFPPLYIPSADWSGVEWLKANNRQHRPVFSLPNLGNVIPAVTGDPVYVGHWGETMDFGKKYGVSLRFFEGELTPSQAESLLRKNRIGYVFQGTIETYIGQRANAPPLDRIYPFLRPISTTGEGLRLFTVGEAREAS